MKPSITKSAIITAVTAAAITTVTGLIPVAALAAPALPELPQKLAGKTVFLDPGHQGPNHTQDENKQVSDGRGGTKACQTTGMTSLHGVAEHTINWNVAQLVRTSLEGLGAHVVMSRADDTGWGGCVDERASAANASGADIALSIHADSGPATGRGFHLIVPQLPVPDAKVNEVQSGAGLAASKAMRDAYIQSGYSAATYNGAVDGLQTRSDIAGPALTTVPDVFLEMGNGANAEDAQQLETPEGQLKHAVTIVTGLASYLLGVPVPPAETEKPAEAATQPGQAAPAQPAQAQVAPAAGPAETPQPVAPVQPQAQVPQTQPQAQVPQSQPQAQAPQAQVPQTQPQAQAPQVQPQAQVPGQSGQTPAQPGQSGQLPAQSNPAPAQSNPGDPGVQGGWDAFQALADQFLNFGQQQGTKPQTQPGQATPPQATPAQPGSAPAAQPGSTPAAKPAAVPAVKPVAGPRAPQRPAPGGQQTPSPGAPGAQANPGVQAQSPDPAGQSPDKQSPKSKSDGGLDVDTMSTLVQTAVKFFGPLAKMLLGNTGVAPDLINLAYSVVSVLSTNMLSTPATK
ncbi:N-acetylmuramoyl-L-alanine amidase [Nocardia yunnanensis]|uniref:N-acetylmuramoyl-L-alanine amidase n=1 Tax=Nocardia yunnanensis TaxID=2382165 RepID=UPI002686F70D